MHWEQDPTTGEWVMRDDMDSGDTPGATTLVDEPARYGPPTAGEPGGPPLQDGPIWEPPQGAGPGAVSYGPDDDVPEYDNGGYTEPNIGYLPDTPRNGDGQYPPDDGGGIRFRPDEWGAPMNPGPMASPYDNIDHAKIAAWEDAARARGNEVRYTVSGTFEVDADGRIVSTMPSPYRLD
jgi:hypothetical protein